MKEAIARYSFGSTFGQGALICSSISFWIGSAWIYTILQGVDFPTCNTIAIVSFAVMPVFIALALTSKMGFMLIGASLAVGISLGAAHACAMNTPHGDGGIPTADYVFTLSEDSVINDYGATAHAFLNVNNQSIRVRLHFLNDSNLLAGCKIHARTTLMDVDVSTLESYWNNGECYKAYIREYSIVDDDGITSSMRFLREDSLEFIDDHVDNPTILKAITCGSRNGLYESPEYDAIRLSGLAHLVAVSGAHLTIVASMMGVLLRALRSPRSLSIAITIALMSFYYLLAGTPISAFRALVMAVLATSSFYVQRRAYSLNALGTSIFVIICFDFYASLSISFLLSALATLGIILFAPSISEALCESVKVVPKAIIETVSVTISALLTVQPVSCALFSQLPTLSIFANLFAAIVFPLSCSFGIIGILFHFISNEIGGIFL